MSEQGSAPEGVEWSADGLHCSVPVEDGLFPARMSVVGALGGLLAGVVAAVLALDPAVAAFLVPVGLAVGMFGGLRVGELWRRAGATRLGIGDGAIHWHTSRFGAAAPEHVVRAVEVTALRLRGPRAMVVVLETRDGATHGIPLGEPEQASWIAERIAEHVRAHGGRAGSEDQVPEVLRAPRQQLRDRE